ncbi:MAG: orotidine-5'-phosphate decarboxylase [Treponema sp.]|nr:orotidine-5'-phosphate decarboxylase [Treponema sp.]
MINIDKLYESIQAKGHVCLGLDTAAEYLPDIERKKAVNDAQAVLAFNRSLIDATYDVTGCYKVQIAYYEEMGIAGLTAYAETLKYIRSKGSLVIADIKRGDIADTATRYARAHFNGDFEADFVTLSPYMGMDSIEPWLKEAKQHGKGAFVLVRTSNPGNNDFQKLSLNDPKTEQKCLYKVVGKKMSDIADNNIGKYGYGIFGIVVGCTEKEEAAEIRKEYSNLFFLIPGYGAQGGGAAEAALLLQKGNGGVVNASRSIITAWKSEKPEGKEIDNQFAAEAARRAAIKMRDEIKGVI